MRIQNSIILILLAAMSLTMSGATVDTDVASRAASRFLSSGRHASINASPIPMKLAYQEHSVVNADAADFYVFNAADGSAFVIIAGDDRAHEVLGYGEGKFDAKRIPDNLRWLLDHYAKQVEYLHAHPEKVFPMQSSSPRDDQDLVIPEMLTTRWGQGTPYRNLCPMLDGQLCVTGCVATSMAQVMNYWQYPAVLPAQAAYVTMTKHIPVPALPAESVEWGLMQNAYPQGSYDEEHANAVAMLMRYCGQACKMDYGIGSSGALPVNQVNAFKEFGYNSNIVLISRSNYADNEWRGKLLDDLSKMRPVVYTGHGSSINHTFVIDGYDGSKYHINWGWNGYQNGYYELDALTPIGLVPTDPQEMIYGLAPSSDSYDFDFIRNGIAYNILDENSVAVARSNNYSGDIVIPDSVRFGGHAYIVTEIVPRAFYGSFIKSILLPQTITAIGSSAFCSTGIKQITIPNSVTTIGNKLFQNCSSLSTVVINSPLTEIVQSMFEGCTALTAFVIPETVTAISDNAFAGSGLADITLPHSVSSVGKNIFKDCASLASVTFGSDSQLSIMGQSMFEGCAALTGVDIPESITTISDNAFTGSGLIDMSLPQSVSSVGKGLFKDCASLKTVSISSNSQLTEIVQSMFEGCAALTGVDIPESITTISDNAFTGSGLIDMSLPQLVSSVGKGVFKDCTSFTSVDFGSNSQLSIIGQSMFEGCTALTVIDIPESVTTINDNAFAGSGLTDIKLPQSVSSVGKNIFQNCINLTTVTFNSQLSIISQGMLEGCTALTNIEIPEKVTTISDNAFTRSGLTNITIPPSVSIVGKNAFKDCLQLSSLKLQGNALSIGTQAFAGAPLTNIICSAFNPPTASANCFNSEVYSNAILRVLPSSVGLFLDVEPWKRFSHIEAFPDSTIIQIGDYCYRQSSDSTLILCLNQNNSERIEIPEEVLYEGRTFTVDVIGDYAFWNNHDLITLVIPRTIRALGVGAFSGCNNLKEITIMSTELSMGDKAFDGTAIEYLACVSEIPPSGNASCFPTSVYDNCLLAVPTSSMSLYKSTVPWSKFSKVISFDSDLVMNSEFCYYLTEDHGVCVFRYFGHGQHVTVPETLVIDDVAYPVWVIGDYVFKGHNEINSVTLPATLRHIGAYAFDHCSNLNGIVFPDSLKYIGDNAFAKCSQLTEIVLPNSVTHIGDQVFYGDTQLKQAILGNGITKIPHQTFYNCRNLMRISLGDNLQSIGRQAFFFCDKLDSLFIPPSLTSIDINCFVFCSQLKHVFISDLAAWCGVSIADLYASPFYRGSGKLYLNGEELIECVIPDGMTVVNDYVFAGCTSIRRVILPASVSSIGKGSFEYCNLLDTINLPERLTRLDDACFLNCTKLERVIMPDSVTSIGNQAFYNCSSLSQLQFGKALLSIGVWSFNKCGALTSLEFPDALEEIGDEAFRNCSNLSSITFGKGLKTIGGFTFATCPKLIELELPRGVTKIGDGAFRDCNGLTAISLPDSITTIGLATFTNCSKLQHIVIPKTITSLAYLAFSGCTSLESIVVKANVPPVCDDVSFDDVNYQNAMLLVPEQSVQAYMAAPEWKRFKSITGVCMSDVIGDMNCDDEVNIADINVLIDAILMGEMDSRLDVNGDGELNVGDINEVISIILQPN